MKTLSFPMAMKDFFGLKSGQTTMDFITELKELTEDDKAEFRALLPSVGYKIK